jgi:multiple sugar transport system substrate-binding protein
MRVRAVLLAAVLVLAPLGARAADLVVWWDKGFYPEEDQAVREVVAAFEHKTGKQVELAVAPEAEIPAKVQVALAAGHPPDFLFSLQVQPQITEWADEDRLVDLTDALGPLVSLFDPDAIAEVMLANASKGTRGLYALPMGRSSNNAHLWTSLLKRAGLALDDVPKEWGPFWSFWCEKVQPAVRKALDRDDVWGLGLPMSAGADDTEFEFFQFVHAYEADYVTRDGRLVIDEPQVRALDRYTAIYRTGCTPPASVEWTNPDNNKAFLAQSVVMTPNNTLSIPNALKAARPEAYYDSTTTIDWPEGAYGQPLVIQSRIYPAVVFKGGGHAGLATEFVRFLVGEGWLAHWLDFAHERLLPPMSALLQQPFWLDPGDPHRMRSAMQFLQRPRSYDYAAIAGEQRHAKVRTEYVWAKAVHRVAADRLTPEQAVDEAIARIHQILSE